ncbi:MAG: TlpA family protein disulfide reductase [Anaerolineales bacterium]
MPKTRIDWTILTLVVAVIGSAWTWTSRVPADQQNPGRKPPAPQVGHPAPDFTLATGSGQSVTLSDFRGAPVVLNFWATWCGPCRAEMPAFERLWREQGGRVQFVGVNVQESPEQVASFAAELGVTYPLPLDPDASVARLYRVRAFPTTLFIDARGVIQEMVLGQINEPILIANVMDMLGP